MVTWKIFKLPDNIAIQNGRTVTLGSPSSSSVFTLLRRLSYSSNPAIWNSTKLMQILLKNIWLWPIAPAWRCASTVASWQKKDASKRDDNWDSLTVKVEMNFSKPHVCQQKTFYTFKNEEFDLPFAFSLEFGRVFHQPTGQGCCCMFYQELCLLIIPKGRLKSMTQKWTCFSITQIHSPSHN